MKRLPRIYYASGMISLLLIPWFGVYFISKRLNPPERCIPVVMCTRDTLCNLCFQCIPPKRIYQSINFTENAQIEKKTLVSIDSMANTLYTYKDTLHGLEVNFNQRSTYKTLINILDICKRRHMPAYLLKDYHFWIAFDNDYEKTCDNGFKTRLIARNKHLLDPPKHDTAAPALPQSFIWGDDIVSVNVSDNKEITNERNKNFRNFVYQRKLLIGLFGLVYVLMVVFTFRKFRRMMD